MLESFLNLQPWATAGVIFLLRVTDMSLDTLRVLVVMRHRKLLAWILGFFQSAIFVLAITSVLKDVNNLLNVVGYAAGFATGNVVGMWIEERLAIGHVHLSIVSSTLGAAIAESLRQSGYAVTEIPARGRDGMVSLLSCSVLRKNIDRVHEVVKSIDPSAFVTSEDIHPVRRGLWRA